MVSRNYKVYATLRLRRRKIHRYSVILNSGSGYTFIRKDVLQEKARKLIKPDPNQLKTRDTNNRQINSLGVINLAVDVGGTVEVMNLKVAEQLALPVIVCCEYCDKHVEAIRPS